MPRKPLSLEIDWSKMELPTDNLTLGDLRRQDPDAFIGMKRDAAAPHTTLLATRAMATEMELAQVIFDGQCGRAAKSHHLKVPEYTALLLDYYKQLGLGSGNMSRKHLVEAVIRGAQDQAWGRTA